MKQSTKGKEATKYELSLRTGKGIQNGIQRRVCGVGFGLFSLIHGYTYTVRTNKIKLKFRVGTASTAEDCTRCSRVVMQRNTVMLQHVMCWCGGGKFNTLMLWPRQSEQKLSLYLGRQTTAGRQAVARIADLTADYQVRSDCC